MTVLNKEMKENRRVELTIRVERQEWQQALDDAYQANRDLYPVDGCAPGKATRQALEQAYAPDVFYQEAVNATFPRALVEAFGQEEILVAGAPELRIVDIGPEGFTFAALAELYPEVKLGQYKGLSAPMPQAELSNDDVDKAMEEWLQAHLVEQERDRAAMGDEVTLDFDGSVDGVPFEGGKAENYPLLLGSGMFIDGFEEQVAGIRPEEEREIHVTFPQQYTPELAGKAAVFRVKAHRIVRRSMPELNDEFAAKCGPFTDMKELKDDIKREITAQKEREAGEKLKDALVGELADASKVALPELLIDDQMRSIEQDIQQNLAYRGITMESYLKTQGFADRDDWVKKEARPAAEKRVKAGLVLAELSKELKIDVSRDELSAQIDQMRQQYGAQDPKLAKQFDDPNVHRDIANRMITDKTVEKLVELNA